MNARINQPKPCIVCGKIMHVEDYESPGHFERTRACSLTCGGHLQGVDSGANWGRMLAHQIESEMSFEEIAAVASVSKQRIFQLYERAVRKLKNNARVLKMLGEWK